MSLKRSHSGVPTLAFLGVSTTYYEIVDLTTVIIYSTSLNPWSPFPTPPHTDAAPYSQISDLNAKPSHHKFSSIKDLSHSSPNQVTNQSPRHTPHKSPLPHPFHRATPHLVVHVSYYHITIKPPPWTLAHTAGHGKSGTGSLV